MFIRSDSPGAGGTPFTVNWVRFCFLVVLVCELGLAVFRPLVSGGLVRIGPFLRPNFRILEEVTSCMRLPEGASYYYHGQQERRAHFLRLHDNISRIIQPSYMPFCWLTSCGPWLEDLWIAMKWEPFEEFGPFVPLFVPWVKMWTNHPLPVYRRLLSQIFALLMPQYLYVTLSHNDDGVDGCDDGILPMNLFVLSQGGKGHVPLLLWLNEFNPADFPIASQYEYDLVFFGGIRKGVRTRMKKILETERGGRYLIGIGYNWKAQFSKAKFVLAPRGYGRNSYRLTEILQMGMIPVYVYDDIQWLPYYDKINWSSFAIVTNIDDLERHLPFIRDASVDLVRSMRMRIHQLYSTHFSSAGLFRHIRLLLKKGFIYSDLQCAPYLSIH
jgi:hypothetical protein